MSTVAQNAHHIHYTALEDLLQEIAASVPTRRRARMPRVRVQPLQLRVQMVRVWGLLVTVVLCGETHSAWVIADQTQLHMVTAWREDQAAQRQQRLRMLLAAYLAEQGLTVARGLCAVPASAFTHPATLPAEVVARLAEGEVQA